ncbi:hypothetical protein FACS1894162_4410 [Bacteroidia bacterium]|nr:hypothetical protein FACS1894162_4410 [Bacteroidia bacterium]
MNKYMKNLGNLLVMIIMIQTFSACEDWLDKIPQDRMTPATFFTNEEELRLYTNSFYSVFPTAEDLGKESADILILSELIQEVAGTRLVPATSSSWSFSALRNINFFLENSSHCKDEKIRERYDGLARFFRAYFYFEKVKRYGDVPWYDKVLGDNDPDLYKPRDSRELVMTNMVKDLDYAIRYLPDTKSLYKVTKWTALALKSRVCLFEGTFRKYHGLADAEKYLTLCAEASEELMTNGGYTIYKQGATPYFSLFSTFDDRPEEYILARDYNESLNISNGLQMAYNSSTGAGRPGLAKKIVDSYLMTDGSRFTGIAGYDTKTFLEETQNRDPRMAQTIRTPGYKQIGGTAFVAPNLAYTNSGYHIIKFSNDKLFDAMKGYNDFPLFRYAETLLNFAEAKAELGTLTQDDLNKSIKLLRDRVGMPNMDLAAANTNPDPYLSAPATGYPQVSGANKGIILEIRRERAIELVVEGFRYWDIMRWKEGKTFEQPFLGFYIPAPGVYNLDGQGGNDVCFWTGTRPAAFVPLFMEIGKEIVFTEQDHGNVIMHSQLPREWREDRDYLYPIPIQERSLTHGALTQNPGWVDGLNF